ncbi:MAG: GNAT family N-acetyltransferase [Bdellovibrionales bacterium]
MTDFAILTTDSAIEALSAEWQELYARVGEESGLFTDPDSFLIWWRTIGKDQRTPYVVTGRKEGRLIGVLPLAIARNHGLRILQAAGYKALSICEVLCETPDLVEGLWKAAKQGKGYHFADIRDVYADSANHAELSRIARRRDTSKAFSLDLSPWSDGEAWFRAIPRKMRYETERKLRKMKNEKGPISFKTYDGFADGPFPEAIMGDLLRHKLNWCQSHDKDGLFSHPKACDFFRELARSAAQRGALNLGWLCCGESTIGYVLNFQRKGILSGYVTSYDPAWSSCSPGILTLIHAIKWAIDHGKKSYDLNQGDYQYKQKFSNAEKECAEFTFGANDPLGWLTENLYFQARATGRRLREVLKSAKTEQEPHKQESRKS